MQLVQRQLHLFERQPVAGGLAVRGEVHTAVGHHAVEGACRDALHILPLQHAGVEAERHIGFAVHDRPAPRVDHTVAGQRFAEPFADLHRAFLLRQNQAVGRVEQPRGQHPLPFRQGGQLRFGDLPFHRHGALHSASGGFKFELHRLFRRQLHSLRQPEISLEAREEAQHAAVRVDQVVGRVDLLKLPLRPQFLHEHVVEPHFAGRAARHQQMDHERAILFRRSDGDVVLHRRPAALLVGAGRALHVAQPFALRVVKFDDDRSAAAPDPFIAEHAAETVGAARLQRQRTADQRVLRRIGALIAERRTAVDPGVGHHPDRLAVDPLPAVRAGGKLAVGQHESGAVSGLAAQIAPFPGRNRSRRDGEHHHDCRAKKVFHQIRIP